MLIFSYPSECSQVSVDAHLAQLEPKRVVGTYHFWCLGLRVLGFRV